jgi:quinol monooxygenase YgiN
MAIMVLLEGKAKAEKVDRLKARLAELFPVTRQYEGCRGIMAYVGANDGRTVVFVEYWETKGHYERYLAWRTETGVIPELVSMLEGPPSIRHFEQIDA